MNEEDIHRLRQINVEEWSLVDSPAIEETWLILKRDSSDYCYCDKCAIKIPHLRGEPCVEQKCPKCGELMRGVPNEAIDYKEMKKMSDELEKAKAKEEEEEEKKKRKKKEEEEEMEKASVKEAAMQAAKLLENATGGSENDKKRIKMLVGNLKSLAGIKKADDEEDEEDVKKVGRSISKETEESLAKVAEMLKQAVDMLGKVSKPKKDEEEYGYPKYGYPKTKKVEEKEITDGLKKIFDLHKQGLVEDSEISELLTQFRSEEVFDNE